MSEVTSFSEMFTRMAFDYSRTKQRGHRRLLIEGEPGVHTQNESAIREAMEQNVLRRLAKQARNDE